MKKFLNKKMVTLTAVALAGFSAMGLKLNGVYAQQTNVVAYSVGCENDKGTITLTLPIRNDEVNCSDKVSLVVYGANGTDKTVKEAVVTMENDKKVAKFNLEKNELSTSNCKMQLLNKNGELIMDLVGIAVCSNVVNSMK